MSSVLETSPRNRLIEELERVFHGEVAEVQLNATLLHGAERAEESPIVVQMTSLEFGAQKFVSLELTQGARARREEESDVGPVKDHLTQLPGRGQLFSRLETLFLGQRTVDRRFTALFIDVDEFKQVNDRYGHLVGDRVLREIARRLAGCIREEDLLVRFGGDEFVALIANVNGWEEYEPVIARMRAAMESPIAVPGGELVATVSIGAAEYSAEHSTPEDLLAAADRAMYSVKRRRSMFAG